MDPGRNGQRKRDLLDALSSANKSLARLSDRLVGYVIGENSVDVDVTVKQEQHVEQPRSGAMLVVAVMLLVIFIGALATGLHVNRIQNEKPAPVETERLK